MAEIVVHSSPVQVVVEPREVEVVPLSYPEAEVVEVIFPGPQGPPGPPTSVQFDAITAEAIGALRAVRVGADGLVRLADKDSGPDVVAVSVTAAGSGASITLRNSGDIVDTGWNWTEGPIWLGSAGALTQTRPTSGSLVKVGRSAGPTRMVVQPEHVANLI